MALKDDILAVQDKINELQGMIKKLLKALEGEMFTLADGTKHAVYLTAEQKEAFKGKIKVVWAELKTLITNLNL